MLFTVTSTNFVVVNIKVRTVGSGLSIKINRKLLSPEYYELPATVGPMLDYFLCENPPDIYILQKGVKSADLRK